MISRDDMVPEYHDDGEVCDARHCRTLEQVADEFAKIERLDLCVRHVILSGKVWNEFKHWGVRRRGEGFLFGAKVEFAGAVMVWGEERVKVPRKKIRILAFPCNEGNERGISHKRRKGIGRKRPAI